MKTVFSAGSIKGVGEGKSGREMVLMVKKQQISSKKH
jgi:hypothetical protein